jgi:uncharacterized protein (DUF362 family)
MNNKSVVSVVSYEKPLESVRKTIELCKAFENLKAQEKVFIKPNLVCWSFKANFPKWGVITTSRVVEDMVILLKEYGIKDITIGEGSVLQPEDYERAEEIYEHLGYGKLKKRYGVKLLDIYKRPFKKINIDDHIELSFNIDAMETDFLVNIPVMKTHSQTVVSLGIKNIKGLLDLNSRKKCHSTDMKKDLNYMISLLPEIIPKSMTIIDGIYTNERGPLFGDLRRSNILIASSDMISADMIGSKILGHDPATVPHLANIAEKYKRQKDLSDIEITGEDINKLISYHEYAVPYNEEGTLPLNMAGIKGLTCKKPGLSICTYCVGLIGLTNFAIGASHKGGNVDEVEILSGKIMTPSGEKKKTILFGKCMYELNKDSPDMKEFYPIKGCPPDVKEIIKALKWAGIEINTILLERREILLEYLMGLYKDKPEFDEKFFKVE